MKLPVLYGKSSSGALLFWECFTEDNVITIRHGQLGGKVQEKQTVCKGKNIGKSNETTDNQQADLEATAKWVKQKKKGYYETKEEALDHVEFTPMKLASWKDQSHKITYPCYVQPKLDGQRYMVSVDGSGLSKQGESIFLPKHIQSDVDKIKNYLGDRFKGLDGEIYAGIAKKGGLSLQRIISAFRKPNEDTHLLKYYVYDIPDSTECFSQRVEVMTEILTFIKDNNLQNVKVVFHDYALGKDEVNLYAKGYNDEGYEGGVVRNAKGKYEFGKRSYDAQKVKFRQTTEAKVLSVEEDKNSQGLLTCQLENGVIFKCLMLKESDPEINLRLYENAVNIVGKHIEVEFEEYSDVKNDTTGGVPTKPVGLRLREVDINTWEAID